MVQKGVIEVKVPAPVCYTNPLSKPADISNLVVVQGTGKWDINSLGFLQQTMGGGGNVAYLNTLPDFSNFEASINVKGKEVGGNKAVHFLLRYNPKKDVGYDLWLGSWPGECNLTKCTTGPSIYFNPHPDNYKEQLYFELVPANTNMTEWHKLGIKAQGKDFTIFLDDKEMFKATSPLFSSGKMGFACINTDCYFKDLQVCSL